MDRNPRAPRRDAQERQRAHHGERLAVETTARSAAREGASGPEVAVREVTLTALARHEQDRERALPSVRRLPALRSRAPRDAHELVSGRSARLPSQERGRTVSGAARDLG